MFEIVNYNPERGYAVVERKDGRQYDVEIWNGKIENIYALGTRKVCVMNRKIGLEIFEVVSELLANNTKAYYIYNGKKVLV